VHSVSAGWGMYEGGGGCQGFLLSPAAGMKTGGLQPPYAITDIGDRNIRNSPVPRFDIYGFPTLKSAQQFGRQTAREKGCQVPFSGKKL